MRGEQGPMPRAAKDSAQHPVPTRLLSPDPDPDPDLDLDPEREAPLRDQEPSARTLIQAATRTVAKPTTAAAAAVAGREPVAAAVTTTATTQAATTVAGTGRGEKNMTVHQKHTTTD